MPVKQKAKPASVPRSEDPIAYLLKNGWTHARLAVAWNCRSDSTVRKLADYNHVPTHPRAALMAKTFGWSSAGEVIDFWAVRVAARAERRSA